MNKKNFDEYIKRLENSYFKAISAFYIYEGLEENRANNIYGDELETKHVKIMNHFKNFFITTRDCTKYYALIQLAKLFDKARQSLHLKFIIDYSKGVQKIDLTGLEKLLKENKNLIDNLILYRDQNLAHDDKKKNNILITGNDLLKLFEIAEIVLNKLSYEVNSTRTLYHGIENSCKEEIKDIFNVLEKNLVL